MPSSPKVQKEEILNTALDLLRREGYGAINIKTVAKEIGCSTQPISRQFGNMELFRAELINAAMDYAQEKMTCEGKNSFERFFESGKACIDLAFDEPNLFRFAFMGESGIKTGESLANFFHNYRNLENMKELSNVLHLSEKQTEFFMNAMVLYTQGVASLVTAGIVTDTRENIHKMVKEVGQTFLLAYGITAEQSAALLEKESN